MLLRNIVGHDVFLGEQTGKPLKEIRNIFLCLGHKLCVLNKCCARVQTGKHLYPRLTPPLQLCNLSHATRVINN